MSLRLSACVRARGFDVDLRSADGSTTAIMGPNGAGKSTLVAIISGLLRADSGSASLSGEVLFDARTWTPAYQRPVALLTQDPLLFPHLNVLDNVAFAPRSAGMGRSAARACARRWLAEVEASDLEDRRPTELSGGQAQRVAVARALAADPNLLLLDEPLAAVDAQTAPALRRMLRRVLAGREAIIVTHSVLDAMILADSVVILENGRISEEGDPQSVFERPRSAFAAGLAGLNLVLGETAEGGLRTAEGLLLWATADQPLVPATPAAAVFSPRSVSVFPTPPAGSPRNLLHVEVTDLEPRGNAVMVRAGHLSAEITTTAAAELDLAPGCRAWFVVKSTAVSLYPL